MSRSVRQSKILSLVKLHAIETQEELAEYFKLGEEIITYGDMEELYYLADYYLKHEEERKCIAANGLERVKKDFRFEDRMRKMIEDVS